MNKDDILKKILKDEPKGFRKKFLDNPKKALENVIGGSLGDWKVEIRRIPKKTITFNLPEDLPSPNKINDKMINEISGGFEKHTGIQTCETCYGSCKRPCKE
jgi:hypothetical protein